MHHCPVCGFPGLAEAPRSPSGGGSYEICPSCGFQFGVDDDDRGITNVQAREKWISGGMAWHSKGSVSPSGWNGADQLKAYLSPAATPKAKKNVPAKRAVKKAAAKKAAPKKAGSKKTAGKPPGKKTAKKKVVQKKRLATKAAARSKPSAKKRR